MKNIPKYILRVFMAACFAIVSPSSSVGEDYPSEREALNLMEARAKLEVIGEKIAPQLDHAKGVFVVSIYTYRLYYLGCIDDQQILLAAVACGLTAITILYYLAPAVVHGWPLFLNHVKVGMRDGNREAPWGMGGIVGIANA